MRNVAALTLAAACTLAACTSSTVGVTPSPGPSGLSVGTQRAEAQAGIAVAEGIQIASLLTSVVQQLPLGGGTLPDGSCKNGVETTVKVINPEQLSVRILVFYEASCKTLFTRALLKTTFFPSSVMKAEKANCGHMLYFEPSAIWSLRNSRRSDSDIIGFGRR